MKKKEKIPTEVVLCHVLPCVSGIEAGELIETNQLVSFYLENGEGALAEKVAQLTGKQGVLTKEIEKIAQGVGLLSVEISGRLWVPEDFSPKLVLGKPSVMAYIEKNGSKKMDKLFALWTDEG